MKKRINYLIILVPFFMGLVFGSLFDLPINQALYSDPTKNVFGLIFSAFMPLFAYAFMSFVGGYLLKAGLKEEKILFKVIYFVLALACLGLSVYFTADKFPSPNAFNSDKWTIPGYIIGLVVEGGVFALGFLIATKKGINKQFVFGTIILLIAITIALVPVSQVLKNIMRRPRYRTLVSGSTFYLAEAEFKNWWEPFTKFADLEAIHGHDAISEHFKSFPSGHTAEAMIVPFALVYISKLFPGQEKKETLFLSIGMIFTLLMAFSRMTMGAHYLSDVSMGGLTCAICLIAGNEFNLRFTYKKLSE